MSANDKDQITEDGAVELDEAELGAVAAGQKVREIDATSQKVNTFDDKTNDLTTQDTTSWKVTVDNISIGNVKK